jgi:hypothetical protein
MQRTTGISYYNLAIPHRELPLCTSRGRTGQLCALELREQSPVPREPLVFQHVSNPYEHYCTLYYGSQEYMYLRTERFCWLSQINY